MQVKDPPVKAGDIRDAGLIPGSGRSPVEGTGNPLRYSCLGNPMDRGAWQATVHGVTKSWARLNTCVCTCTHTHPPTPHKDIQQFLLQTHSVEHQKPSANRTKTSRHPTIMILVPFHVWEDASVWLHRDGSFDKHLNYLVAVSCFYILNSPRGAPSELRLWLKA